jgi:hypothetical protein
VNDRSKDEGEHKESHEHGHLFKVQIDKQVFEIADPTPTGRQLLELAGKRPPDQFALYKKGRAGQPVRVGLAEHVDLKDPGIERFVTLPLDQTEGFGESRRHFALPAEDMEWLDGLGLRYELVNEGGVLRVLVYDWAAPAGYDRSTVDVNVRIEAGYPDTQIDMVYFFPGLQRVDGKAIAAICADGFDGKTWQRWSRHRTPANPWRPGIDNLSTHFAAVDAWLSRELTKV